MKEDLSTKKIYRFGPTDGAGVYIGGVTALKAVTGELIWRKTGEGEYSTEYLTLGEIYEQLERMYGPHVIITVFTETALHGNVYQCGNYERGLWVRHGNTDGYA